MVPRTRAPGARLAAASRALASDASRAHGPGDPVRRHSDLEAHAARAAAGPDARPLEVGRGSRPSASQGRVLSTPLGQDTVAMVATSAIIGRDCGTWGLQPADVGSKVLGTNDLGKYHSAPSTGRYRPTSDAYGYGPKRTTSLNLHRRQRRAGGKMLRVAGPSHCLPPGKAHTLPDWMVASRHLTSSLKRQPLVPQAPTALATVASRDPCRPQAVVIVCRLTTSTRFSHLFVPSHSLRVARGWTRHSGFAAASP